ncbi:MAG: hypothetical protein WBB76_00740 [Gaiellaceae bacterium]
MSIPRKTLLATMVASAMLVGGAVGAVAFAAGSSGTSSNGSQSSGSANSSSRAFTPIETKSHEAVESAAREAQEDAGQVPTVP